MGAFFGGILVALQIFMTGERIIDAIKAGGC